MYEHFFGLKDEPFRLTPDPHYLYLSPKHAEALAHLRLGLTDSSGFVCITGEVGTGKTTLLRSFLAELGPNVTAAYIFVPPPSALELLRNVCRELGCYVAGLSQTQLIEELHEYLVEQHKAGRVCVVIIDEAQALSVELLEQIRLLLNLETATHKLLRIVLVGQPQLRKLLLDPGLAQLNQRITLRWHLGPLTYRETAAYVEHRLNVANGGQQVRLFTRPALRLLHSVSGGVPRLVNMIAHRTLLAAYVARCTLVTRRWVAHAYREIQAVPLPGTLSPLRKGAWAAAGLLIGTSLVAFGAPQLERLFGAPPQVVQRESQALATPADGSANTPQGSGVAASFASQPPGRPALGDATTPPSAQQRARPLSAGEVAQRLAALDAEKSARAATEDVLRAWGAPPIAPGDQNFESVAWRNGMEALALAANRSMLQLLNLPAVLALRAPETQRLCFVAMLGLDDSRVSLVINGETIVTAADVLDRFWAGQAHVFWRDFEALGAGLRRGARGAAVVNLQQLLRRAGQFHQEPTGVFEAMTESAVREFQRTNRLDPDGIVGPLTNILLYAAATTYSQPTLNAKSGNAS